MVAGRRDAVPRAAQNVEAEGLDGVQPLDLNQTGQQVRDAVSRCTDAVEELHAVRHASDLVTLQAEALGEVPPRLHHCLVCAVGGAEHAAAALQTVERKLGRTQTCADKHHHHHQSNTRSKTSLSGKTFMCRVYDDQHTTRTNRNPYNQKILL